MTEAEIAEVERLVSEYGKALVYGGNGLKAAAARDALVAAVRRLASPPREALREVERALSLAEAVLHEAADPHVGYGGFHGGDPRNFTPDPECSTEEERAAHRAACGRWDRGEAKEPEPDTHSIHAGEDGSFLHVALAGYGLGTYVLHDEQAEAALRAVRDARAALASPPDERTEPPMCGQPIAEGFEDFPCTQPPGHDGDHDCTLALAVSPAPEERDEEPKP